MSRALGVDDRGRFRQPSTGPTIAALPAGALHMLGDRVSLRAIGALDGPTTAVSLVPRSDGRSSTRSACAGTLASMKILLRVALQVVLFFLLLSLVMAIASPQTGAIEKAALIAAGAVLVWLASLVRRIGPPVRQA